jgi:hypothetical protein
MFVLTRACLHVFMHAQNPIVSIFLRVFIILLYCLLLVECVCVCVCVKCHNLQLTFVIYYGHYRNRWRWMLFYECIVCSHLHTSEFETEHLCWRIINTSDFLIWGCITFFVTQRWIYVRYLGCCQIFVTDYLNFNLTILNAVFNSVVVFKDFVICIFLPKTNLTHRHLIPEDGNSMYLRNVRIYLRYRTAREPRTATLLSSSPWKPQISQSCWVMYVQNSIAWTWQGCNALAAPKYGRWNSTFKGKSSLWCHVRKAQWWIEITGWKRSGCRPL